MCSKCSCALFFVIGLASFGVMGELKRFRTSRRGYRSHTTKLLSGIQDLLTVDNSEEAVSTIELTLEQLQRKQTILEELDAKIAPFITEETELEEEVMEAEDTRTNGVARLKVKLNSIHTESTEPPPVPKTVQRTQPSTNDGTPLMHFPPVVSNTSDSSTLHTVSVTTSHTSPTLEAAASIPISSEAVTT